MRAFFTTGPVVQRPSIRPCQGRDRRFESGRDRSFSEFSPPGCQALPFENLIAAIRSVVLRSDTVIARCSLKVARIDGQ